MSKKQLRNRLDSLFADLEQDASVRPSAVAQLPDFTSEKLVEIPLPGWTWESDPLGCYTFCGPEVQPVLGYEPGDFASQPVSSFALDAGSSISLELALSQGIFPLEISVRFESKKGELIPAVIQLMEKPAENGEVSGLRGFVRLIQTTPILPHEEGNDEEDSGGTAEKTEQAVTKAVRRDGPAPDRQHPAAPAGKASAAAQPADQQPFHYKSILKSDQRSEWVLPATPPNTRAGRDSLQNRTISAYPSTEDEHAAMAVPIQVQEQSLGLLEIIDDTPDRYWSTDERRLVEQINDQLSLALENAYLFQAEQRRANELNTLVELSRLISQNMELEDIYHTAYRIISGLMPVESFLINLYEKAHNEFTSAYVIDRGERLPVQRFPADRGFSGYVVRTGKPYIVYDLAVEPTPFERHMLGDTTQVIRSAMALPLVFSGETIGAMSVQSYQPNSYTEDDLRLLGTFADHITIALQNTRLFKQTEAHAEELRSLHDISLELAQQQRDLNTLLEIITRRAMTLLNSDGGGIWLWREEDQELELVITYQVGDVDLSGRRLKPGEGLVGLAYNEGKLQTIDDYKTWSGRSDKFTDAPFRSGLAVPMVWQSKVVGALTVTRSQAAAPYTPGEQSLAELLSGQAAAVLQNARLYQQEQRRRQIADTLRETARVLGSTLDLREVIERMLDQLGQLIDYNTASFQLVQKGKRKLIGGRGFDIQTALQGSTALWRPISEDPLIAEVVQSREPLHLPDTQRDARWEVRPDTSHVRSWITSPLLVGQEVVGLLTLDHTQPNAYSGETVELASAIAAQTAIAIQNARLFEQSQDTLAETETLYLASAELNTAQSYDDVLGTIRRHTLAGQGSHLVSIVFFDRPWSKDQRPDAVEVLSRWTQSTVEGLDPEYNLSTFSSVPQLLRPDVPLLVEDVQNDPRIDEEARQLFAGTFGAKSALFVSIVASGQWLGFVNAIYPHSSVFPENEVRRMAALVNQAGVAIQNLRNIELAEKRALEAQKRSEELSLINRVVAAVVSSHELSQVLDTMASELFDVFALTADNIALLSEDKKTLNIVASRPHAPGVFIQQGVEIPIQSNPAVIEVMSSRKPLQVIEAQNSPLTKPMHEFLQANGIENLLIVPIVIANNFLGMVNLGIGSAKRAFTPEEVRLAETLVAQLSAAIQTANLFEQIETALSETETLYQASAELNAVQNHDNILAVLRKYTVLGSASTTNVTINLFDRPWIKDEVPDSYLPIARWANSPYTETPHTRIPMRAWTTVKQILRPDSPTLIVDVKNDPRVDQTARSMYVDRLEAKSLLFAPLNVGGKFAGYINAVYSRETQISEKEIRSLMALASQAGVAIQNIRLLEESRRRAAQLETAAEIARDTSGTLALDTLLKRAVNLIRDRYGYYHASIFLLDETGLTAIIRESTGEAGEEMKRRAHRLPVGSRSIIGYVTELGKPLVINDVTQDPIHRPNPLLPETRAELGLPLKIGNRVIGAMDVQSVEVNAFNPDDISVIQTLADQIAVAVDNAKSYELAQQAIQETRQRVQELSVLFNVSQELASASMDPGEISQIIGLKLLDVMNVTRFSLYMFDEDKENLHILAEMSRSRENLADNNPIPTGRAGRSIPRSEYLDLSQIERTLQPYIAQSGDSELEPELLVYLREENLTAVLLFPLVIKGEMLGMIELATWEYAYTYTPDQFNLTVTVINAAVVALENAQLYEEQRQVTEKLREVDKLKSQFLANMSHELRTPLNSIIGFSRVILKGIDGPISELQQQDLTAIHNSGTHLLSLINNVLDISKIEAGKMELSFDDEVNLVDMINGVMTTTVALVKDKPVRLEKIVEPDLPTVRADPTRIRQVMLNLLSNSAKFTEEGTITLWAGVETNPEGERVVLIKVSDTGMGIAPIDQKKLFQPFSQVDESATRKTGGSGLGLSISRLLVEMHGGRIGVISDIGQGSTFYFTLPLAPAEAEAGKKVILCIDDERQVLNLYDRYLTEHGYQVIPLSDPYQAVERVLQVKPFAVTLDIMMPGRNGWQVLEELKNNPRTRNIPVIVCSIIEDQEKGFSLGAADYLAKPILEDDLINALERLNGDGSIREILVVDDDPDDLRLVEKILEDQFTVRLARGGLEGLAAMRARRPGAVILDLFMPGMDGFAFLEQVRAAPELRDIPVIIFTAGDLTEEQHQKLSHFTQEMLSKSSFEEEEMLSILQKTLNRLAIQKENKQSPEAGSV